jgi:pyruvate-ferredoxin/flavodoxin oxidoreductase
MFRKLINFPSKKFLPLFQIRHKYLAVVDGCGATSHAAYALSDASFIYPITPSSAMAENMDVYASKGRKNVFGQTVRITSMQSEGGAAGAIHGSLATGALTSTFTASQGLLLMIPNMYKISGELMPGVFHVAARAVAGEALSIFGDHQDVMAIRSTGFILLNSASVQEAADLSIVSHLSAFKASLPILHFFDGFRTSHEMQKIEFLDYDEIKSLVDFNVIQKFRKTGLNPEYPHMRGTAQSPDIYFQATEGSNQYYEKVPSIVENEMKKVSKITGRNYDIMEYYGSKDADRVIVAMGSSIPVIQETIDYLNSNGEKVGMIKVRLYRPWCSEKFMSILPKTVKTISVLDRTKEPGSFGEPMFLDVCSTLKECNDSRLVLGGRYGLGSKDFTPTMIKTVYDNMSNKNPKNHFVVGIKDDITNKSLELSKEINTIPKETVQCLFWGIGGDGTVGANQSAIEIIGLHTPLFTQGYFQYDAKKSGGVTISHLRFGEQPITSHYLIQQADYIAVHKDSYAYKYDVLKTIKEGGIFVLNSDWNFEQMDKLFPGKLKRTIANKKVKFYNVNGLKIAKEVGLGGKVNMIMQSVFFKLSNVLPVDKALNLLKDSIREQYGSKGDEVVKMNIDAVDNSLKFVEEIKYPESWKDAKIEEGQDMRMNEEHDLPRYVKEIMYPMSKLTGDELPVSIFPPGGRVPTGTSKFEKRGIALDIPEWQPQNCIQCNYCSMVCPHAAIRPFLLTDDEVKTIPNNYVTIKGSESKVKNLNFRIQVSPYDCTGCSNCVDVCPTEENSKALVMKPSKEQFEQQKKNWEFSTKLPIRDTYFDKTVIKGSQFSYPYLEFSGACIGCGETPYIKLVTQLYGDRMIIANATGCSSIWAGSAPACPYTTDSKGFGPAWANSLFEDNAEYGLGMQISVKQQRELLKIKMEEILSSKYKISPELKKAFENWMENMYDGEKSKIHGNEIKKLISENSDPELNYIRENSSLLIKKSQWIIGGDGWAYDIGFGGLNHVLASGEDVNILVLDTEVYSNTGGQASKATPKGSVAKFAASGKKTSKMDLGALAMTYGNVYVASVSMGAKKAQLLKAISEAESYPGVSLIIAYAPCIAHGSKTGMSQTQEEQKFAVECGYWPLYRYNPLLKVESKNPFMLDQKKLTKNVKDYIYSQTRYGSLKMTFPEEAEKLHTELDQEIQQRHNRLLQWDESGIGF